MRHLAKRVLTAVVFVLVLLGAFFALPEWGAPGVIGLLLALAGWEWAGFLGGNGLVRRAAYAVLVMALVAAATAWILGGPRLHWLAIVSVLWWTLAFGWIIRYPVPIGLPAAAVSGVFVLVPAGASIMWLLAQERGPMLVLGMLVMVWAADIGAYFCGRRFGRVKLAPDVSPGKTWEGVIGGLLAACAVAVPLGQIGGVSLLQSFSMGLSVAAISVVGDLTVSMFKRNAGLKDSGVLFPGHGGVLDRIDGVTAAAPLFLVEMLWFGLAAV
jgi:phosphatidate cytidylyltransferase